MTQLDSAPTIGSGSAVSGVAECATRRVADRSVHGGNPTAALRRMVAIVNPINHGHARAGVDPVGRLTPAAGPTMAVEDDGLVADGSGAQQGRAVSRGANFGGATATAAPGRRQVLAAEAALLAANLALVALVKHHPGPLMGDVRLTVAWQRLVRPHRWLRRLLVLDSTLNWPFPVAIVATATTTIFARRRRRLDILVSLGTLALADASGFLVNLYVRRPRPAGHSIDVTRPVTVTYSFPSGHVAHALAFLGIVTFLSTRRSHPTPPWLRVVRGVLVAEMVLMSPSRVLQGEHWPSDGLAGLLHGGLCLLTGVQVYGWAARRWPRLVPPEERRLTAGPATQHWIGGAQ